MRQTKQITSSTTECHMIQTSIDRLQLYVLHKMVLLNTNQIGIKIIYLIKGRNCLRKKLFADEVFTEFIFANFEPFFRKIFQNWLIANCCLLKNKKVFAIYFNQTSYLYILEYFERVISESFNRKNFFRKIQHFRGNESQKFLPQTISSLNKVTTQQTYNFICALVLLVNKLL